MVNHLGPAVIHSALSITVGIDFMGGKKKQRKRDRQRKKSIIVYTAKICSQRITILSHIAISSSLFVFITCGMKGRESETVMVTIA